MLANLSRRQSLKGLALFGLGASVAAPLGAKPALAQPAPSDIKDEDIFQFALNLEYMEAEYYLRATTGKGIDAADAAQMPATSKAAIRSSSIARTSRSSLRNWPRTSSLTSASTARRSGAGGQPAGDRFRGWVRGSCQRAGLPEFDPFANDMNFLLGGMLFEDVGVTAYAGAAPVLKKKEFVEAAAGILAVEAYHMGMARSQLYEMGEKAHKAANALSDARDKLDGPEDKDQGIVRNGRRISCPQTRTGSRSAGHLRRCCTSSI